MCPSNDVAVASNGSAPRKHLPPRPPFAQRPANADDLLNTNDLANAVFHPKSILQFVQTHRAWLRYEYPQLVLLYKCLMYRVNGPDALYFTHGLHLKKEMDRLEGTRPEDLKFQDVERLWMLYFGTGDDAWVEFIVRAAELKFPGGKPKPIHPAQIAAASSLAWHVRKGLITFDGRTVNVKQLPWIGRRQMF
jgi:hypothetical protein